MTLNRDTHQGWRDFTSTWASSAACPLVVGAGLAAAAPFGLLLGVRVFMGLTHFHFVGAVVIIYCILCVLSREGMHAFEVVKGHP